MESCSLQSSTVTSIPTSLTKSGFFDKNCLHGQLVRFPSAKKKPHGKKIRTFDIKARSSGVTKISSGAVEAISEETEQKDDNLAFVAGATGRVGSRTVRELLKLGFQVRAGVRSAQRAETLVESVKQMKFEGEGVPPVEKLEIVECDLEKPNEIGAALGNASIVLCCIGASEKELFDITGPYRIDYVAAKNLIDAATVAKVKHFFMVSSLGTNKIGFPAALLNLFWGVLIWKRKAEEALIASGIPYTIVTPGGMERPTDAFKETHNITLSEEDTLFGGLVSNLQVAELMAFMAKNLDLSYCKVVEVIAETTAPLTPMDQLLTRIPSQRVKPKEPAAAKVAEPAPLDKISTKAPSPPSPIEEKPEEPKATVSRPLSPYAAYPDLKPPTSPSPTPSGPKETASDAATAEVESPVIGGNDVVTSSSSNLTPSHSPFLAYDDLKPPTSPTPGAPLGSVPTSPTIEMPEGGNNAPPSSPVEEEEVTESKPRPLSPYTMYEDMKPPTSPTPSGN